MEEETRKNQEKSREIKKSLIMARSDSKSSSLEKWELTMQKLLGVEMGKVRTFSFNVSLFNQIQVWLCWTIFAIKIVCAPLNLIFGGVFYNESSEEQHLPPLMIAGGLLEVGLARLLLLFWQVQYSDQMLCQVPWVLLVFFLYVLLPLKRVRLMMSP